MTKQTNSYPSALKSAGTGITILMIALALASVAWGQGSETVIYNFPGGAGGQTPGGLIVDASGNFYGVTQDGGANGYGAVFELSPASGGGWTESVLYSFAGGSSGQQPQGNLVFDAAGNLYGTAWGGNGYGIVYKLAPARSGWKQRVLYTFSGGGDGATPWSGLAIDAAGNLYGTTYAGGKSVCFYGGCGVVYKLSFGTGRGWKETVLHSFANKDGANPRSTPLLDAAGNLYGTTTYGGSVSKGQYCAPLGCGVAYELSSYGGGWKETVLHTFVGGRADGGNPVAGLAWDASGNLYGAAATGTSISSQYTLGCGDIFQLSPNSNGTWTETFPHVFDCSDGAEAEATPVLDSAGNLYGTAALGGAQGFGTAYELSPSSSGWAFSVIYSFVGFSEGGNPDFGLIRDQAGNLYGTSTAGGDSNNINCASGCGIVFELTP
jgi:uncharacterized repeat protein (TIGR03803 family)